MTPFPDSPLSPGDGRAGLRPYKFAVQAVVQTVNADGVVTGEMTTDQVVVFGVDELAEWARRFPDELAKAEAQTP